jgi:peptidyl-tRNA hydrolase, PTH1 family
VGHPGREKMLSYVLDDFSSTENVWVNSLCDAIARQMPALLDAKHDMFQTEVSKLSPAPPIPAWLRGGSGVDDVR